MQIWPAIDLRGGKCVRLQQGDYDRETVFGSDPAQMARHWVDQGAECLHLVDLDGAREGLPANLDCVERIRAQVDVPCQLGGGIRDESSISRWLELGIDRLIIGSKAIEAPDWVRQMCRKYAGRLVLGIDARDGRVATGGWLKTSETRATELARAFGDEPLAGIVFTDIATDGMLAGPNFAALDEMRQATALPVIASGGVTTVADVSRLRALGLSGCIIGRGLYDGTIQLSAAIAAARSDEGPSRGSMAGGYQESREIH